MSPSRRALAPLATDTEDRELVVSAGHTRRRAPDQVEHQRGASVRRQGVGTLALAPTSLA